MMFKKIYKKLISYKYLKISKIYIYMTSINNDLKKVLREKYKINNITASRIKAGYQSTELFYNYLNNLYIREKDEELEELKQKEKIQNELKEKLDKLKQKNKLKKLKYKLNKKKKLNDVQDNISENDDKPSQDFNLVNDLNDFQCNDKDNDITDDTNIDFQNSDTNNDQCNNESDDISSDENENNCIETYNNDTTIEVKNELYIFFCKKMIENNNNVYLLYLIELLKNFYKNNSNYKKFINESNYIKLEIVKDIHSYNNEHFNGIFYDTGKEKVLKSISMLKIIK